MTSLWAKTSFGNWHPPRGVRAEPSLNISQSLGPFGLVGVQKSFKIGCGVGECWAVVGVRDEKQAIQLFYAIFPRRGKVEGWRF